MGALGGVGGRGLWRGLVLLTKTIFGFGTLYARLGFSPPR